MTRAVDCTKAHLNAKDFDTLDARQKALVRESVAEFKKNNPGKDATPTDPNESWALAAAELADDLGKHKKAVLKALDAEDTAAAEAAKPKPKPKPKPAVERKFDNVPDLAEAVAKENGIEQPVADAWLEKRLGQSVREIATDMGVSETAVKEWIKKFTPLMEKNMARVGKWADAAHAAVNEDVVPGQETAVEDSVSPQVALESESVVEAAPVVSDEVAPDDQKDETDANLTISNSKYAKVETKAHDDSTAKRAYKKALRGGSGAEAQFNALSEKIGSKVTWADVREKGQVWFETARETSDAAAAHLAVVEAHDEGLLNSVAKAPRNPTTVEGIKAALERWFPAKDFSSFVRVFETLAEASAAVPELAARFAGSAAVMVPKTGKVYMIAGHIPVGRELSVFLHEVGVHVGMGSDRARINSAAARVNEWARTGDAVEKGIAARALARVEAADKEKPLSDRVKAEETVAYAVEEAVNAGITPSADPADSANASGWLHSVLEFFRNAVGKIFGTTAPDLSLQDLVDVAYGAANLSAPLTQLDTNPLASKIDGVRTVSLAADERAFFDGLFASPADLEEFHESVPSARLTPGGLEFGASDYGGLDDYLGSLWGAAKKQYGGEGASTLPKSFASAGHKFLRKAEGPLESRVSLDLNEFKGATWADKVRTVAEEKWRTMPGVLGWLSTEQLGERFKALPAVQKFSETMQRMSGRATELANTSDAVKKRWEAMNKRFGTKVAADFNTLLQESSDAQVWPDVPFDHAKNKHVVNDADASTAHEKLSAIYAAMPADAKVLYHDVLGDLKSQHDAMVNAYGKGIVEIHAMDDKDSVITGAARLRTKDARDRYVEGKTTEQIKAVRALWKDLDRFHSEYEGKLSGPYFPKIRYGDHVVYFKSPAMMQAEASYARAAAELSRMEASDTASPIAEIESDLARLNRLLRITTDPEKRKLRTEEIADLKALLAVEEAPLAAQREAVDAALTRLNDAKAQADQYHVEFFESLADAKAREAQLKSVLGDKMQVRRELRNQYLAAMDSASPAYVNRLEQRLTTLLGDEAGAKAATAMKELRLQMLPENSAGKARLKRLGVAGVQDKQTLRSYATAALRGAFAVSRLEYRDQLHAHLNDLRFGDDADGKLVGNELAKRLVQNMQAPAGNKLISAASNWTYMTHLGMNASFMAVQFTQPAIISAPILAGRHGIRAALSALKDGYPALTSMLLKSGTLDVQAAVKAGKLTAGEGAMLQGMIDHGRVDTTVRHDLGATSSGEEGGWLSKVAAWSGTPAHRLEMVNRVSTALAAYRLEVAKGVREGMSPTDAAARAQSYADQIVSETHLNYAPENRARFMHPSSLGGFGRILWQFKSYQQGMVFLVMKNLVDAKRGDKEAQRSLAYLMGMQFATAGLTGLPFMTPMIFVATMLAKAFQDDDQERDLRHWLRQGIASVGGETFADLVTKGAPAALGLDISKRTGLGDILVPAPYLNDQAKGKGMVENLWFQLTGGPAGGIAANWVAAIQAANAGQFVKAATMAAPKAIGSVIKAGDVATRGMTNSKGEVLVRPDEFGMMEIALQAMSFQTTKVTNVYDNRSAFQEAKGKRDEVHQRLLRDYAQTRLRGGDVRDVLEEVKEFNVRNPSARVTRAALERAVQQRKVQQKATRGGVAVGKRDRDLANELDL